jgi:hypothetical protein
VFKESYAKMIVENLEDQEKLEKAINKILKELGGTQTQKREKCIKTRGLQRE